MSIKLNQDTKQVQFMGVTVAIPAAHNWVALANYRGPKGRMRKLIISYSDEPRLSSLGNYMPQVGTEDTIIAEVQYDGTVEGTLAFVGDKKASDDAEHVILANLQELADKINAGLKSGDAPHKIIHDLMCPEHGQFVGFMEATLPAVIDYFNEDEDDLAEEEEEIPAEIKAFFDAITGRKTRVS